LQSLVRMSILQRLKSETLAWHQQVEQRVDVMNRVQSVDAYRKLLVAFYGFYVTLEAKLAEVDWKPLGIDWTERRKIHLLERDLRLVGADTAGIARCEHLPSLADEAHALGCLYVLEGATLGGQYIERQLAQQLHITPESGAAFFHSYGERRREMWNLFREALVRFAMNAEREDQIVKSATETFQKLDAWLAKTWNPTQKT
jgi:heme oxygenase